MPFINYPGITVAKINKVENKNYLFVDIIISSSAKAGSLKIGLINDERIRNWLIMNSNLVVSVRELHLRKVLLHQILFIS